MYTKVAANCKKIINIFFLTKIGVVKISVIPNIDNKMPESKSSPTNKICLFVGFANHCGGVLLISFFIVYEP